MVPSQYLMCPDHWRRVPASLQKRIYETHAKGRFPDRAAYHAAIREVQQALRDQDAAALSAFGSDENTAVQNREGERS